MESSQLQVQCLSAMQITANAGARDRGGRSWRHLLPPRTLIVLR